MQAIQKPPVPLAWSAEPNEKPVGEVNSVGWGTAGWINADEFSGERIRGRNLAREGELPDGLNLW